MRVGPGGPAYRHLPVRGRIIGKSGGVKFFGYPANPYGARRRAGCFPYNPKQVAILPAIQVQSGCTGMIVRDVQCLNAQLQGSLRSNTDTECRLAIGFVPIERLGERQVVLVGKFLRARLEAYKGPRMRNAIRVAAMELPGGVAIRTLRKGARSRVETQRQPGADRKSTRLNSSHLVISYAVFCLKKKKMRSGPRPQCLPSRPLRHPAAVRVRCERHEARTS